MELKQLTDKTLELFGIDEINKLSDSLLETVLSNNTAIYEKFAELVQHDLSVDWLQKIFQYYMADRKEKM